MRRKVGATGEFAGSGGRFGVGAHLRLGTLIADWRYAHRIGIREAAKKIGISTATLNRVENNKPCNAETLIKIHAWLHAPAQDERRGKIK
jgi:transcriptional regulator with XRE-family HTH domain